MDSIKDYRNWLSVQNVFRHSGLNNENIYRESWNIKSNKFCSLKYFVIFSVELKELIAFYSQRTNEIDIQIFVNSFSLIQSINFQFLIT